MSLEATKRAWAWQVSPTQKLVLVALADFEQSDGAFPALARLVERTGLSERAVRSSLRALEQVGAVSCSYKAGPNGVNAYRVLDPAPPAPGSTRPRHKVPPAGRARNPAPHAPDPAPPAVDPAPDDAHPAPPAPKRSNGSSTSLITTLSPDFDRWWELYPKKVGKADAAKKWAIATRATPPDVLIAALEAQLPGMRAKERRFQPNPATWLHQGRWLDEPEQPRNGSTKHDETRRVLEDFVARHEGSNQ